MLTVYAQYSKWHEKMGFADEREEAVEHFYKMGEGIIEKPLVRAAVYGAAISLTGYVHYVILRKRMICMLSVKVIFMDQCSAAVLLNLRNVI